MAFLPGGMTFDTRDIVPLDEDAVRRECREIRDKGITDIVVAGVFSPPDTEGRHEAPVRDIILEEIGADSNVDVVISRDVGQMGFLERENAAILNASILKFARRTILGLKKAMVSIGLGSCPLFLTQNDGTVIDAVSAEKCPVRTFNSGPTNSMTGAAYLAGLLPLDGGNIRSGISAASDQQVIVADVGGNTADVSALLP